MTRVRRDEYDSRHILDQYGILLAIRWPRDYTQRIRIDCLQDVLPEVTAYLCHDDSLVRLKSSAETCAIDWPAGIVKNGILQAGPQAGQKLSTAAKAMFSVLRRK